MGTGLLFAHREFLDTPRRAIGPIALALAATYRNHIAPGGNRTNRRSPLDTDEFISQLEKCTAGEPQEKAVAKDKDDVRKQTWCVRK